MTADDLIVHFLLYVKVAQSGYITHYMERAWKYAPGTTRNAIMRLARRGRIVQMRRGWYQLGKAASGGASNNTAGLGHNLKG